MELREPCSVGALRFSSQQPGKQRVVAVPPTVRVELEKHVVAFECRECASAVCPSRQVVRKRAVEAITDRRVEEELANPRRLSAEHLCDEVLRDRLLCARQCEHEGLRPALRPQRKSCKPKRGCPALGPVEQCTDELRPQVEPRCDEELSRLVRCEGELLRTELRQLAGLASDSDDGLRGCVS